MSGNMESIEHYSETHTLLESMKDSLTQKVENKFEIYDEAAQAISILANAVSELMTKEYTKSLQQSSKAVEVILNRLYDLSIAATAIEVLIPNYEKTKGTINRIAPYIEEIAEPEKNKKILQKFKEKLSLDTIVELIALLFSVYTFIVSTLPNKQLEQIIEQNKILIAQNDVAIQRQEESNELDRERNDLLKQIEETIIDLANTCDCSEAQVAE